MRGNSPNQGKWIRHRPLHRPPLAPLPRSYEGPDCSLDINECVRGTDNCAVGSAACVNTDGGFVCKCAPGYTGDGVTCAENAAQASAIRSSFVTMGPAALACDEGTDVTYPEGALGFAYDPTGGLANVSGTEVGGHRRDNVGCRSLNTLPALVS